MARNWYSSMEEMRVLQPGLVLRKCVVERSRKSGDDACSDGVPRHQVEQLGVG